MNKNVLRSMCKEKRLALDKNERKRLNNAIVMHIEKLKEYKDAAVVALYYPTKGEADVTEILNFTGGKTVCFPKCMPGGRLKFFVTESIENLKPGAFGIMEPDDACEEISAEKIEFMIIPGLVFGRDMHRVGYGKGFYDKVLCCMENCVKCGVAYEFQVMDTAPHESHDIRMDLIVCENGVIKGEPN